MPTTLVSFLGTGRKASRDDKRSAYEEASYLFRRTDGQAVTRTSSLFGAALLEHLTKGCGLDVTRWLVLGTSASLWSELRRVCANHDAIEEDYIRIDDKVIDRCTEPSDLAAWEEQINAHQPLAPVRLALVGEALDDQSQQKVCRALFDNIGREHDVVFDVTHGFRHQPILATFVVSLMRRTHNLGKVSFYYGAFEARQADVVPVIELPLCQRILEATEATAVLDATGNYTPIAAGLDIDAEDAWFFESSNQLHRARTAAQRIRAQVAAGQAPGSVVYNQLADLLRRDLAWSSEPGIALRYRARAEKALQQKDYLQSVILVYEALLLEAIRILRPGADMMNYDVRKEATERIWDTVRGRDRQLLMQLKTVRNACAHGTRSDEADAQAILGSRPRFVELISQALKLFDRWPGVMQGKTR